MRPNVRLGELIRVKHGYAFDGEYFGDFPPGDILVTPGNFNIGGGFNTEKLKYYRGPDVPDFILRAGDLIVTMTDLSKNADTLGLPALIPESHSAIRFLHNQRIGRVEFISDLIDKRFLYYLMCSRNYRAEILASATGTTVKHTAPVRIEAFSFTLPPLPEQRAIASILGALDDKMELNRKMSATLEAIARALFKSWFVDFDPVRAKVEGRGLGLPAEIAALFPDSFEETAHGQIPSGWRVGALGDLISQRVDRCDESEETASKPYVPIDCIGSKSLLLDAVKPGYEAKSSLTRFYKDDILFGAMRPYFHKVCVAPFDGITRTTVFTLYPRERADFAFVTLLLHDDRTIDYATAHSTGTTIPYAVWRNSLERMQTVIPPPRLRETFGEVVGPALQRTAEVFSESQTLSQLLNTLLPKLISGELRVGEAERVLAASA